MADNKEMFELLTKMYSEVQGIKSEVQGIKSEVKEMKSDVNGRLDSLEITVNKTNIVIENDIKPKIEALFDGYKQNTESINVLTGKVDDLQTDVNNLTIRTLKNENNMNHFSKVIENKNYKSNV